MLLRLTPHLAVRTPWRYARVRPGERHVVVCGSRAFPPSHPSTNLCLELLTAACRDAPPRTLLDLGCGSGVLALAAVCLGVPVVVGVDVAGPALATCRANARRNGLEGAVQWLQGSSEALRGTFDLIVANLPWPVQMDKIAELARLGSGGLILSGFRDTQEAELLAGHRAWGWHPGRRLTRERWEIETPREGSYTWVGLLLTRG
ncbi:MAG: methyltransferase [Methanosarcinales archaeon]|nr:methyltransferase [Methanosarcinales archaeon]